MAVTILAVGCADGVTAPGQHRRETIPVGAPTLPNALVILNSMSADETEADFTVTPTGGFFRMGKHSIYFPANAICDPATTSYGPAAWDAPCTVLRRPIDIHAELRTQDGREWVDFSPELRFAPSNFPLRWVWIFMNTEGAASGDESLNILWSPAIGVPGIDESLTDPTLKTYVSRLGYAYRRIKHFSGYNVPARSEERELEPVEESSNGGY